MSDTLANFDHDHSSTALFRRPGDVHVHFLGAAGAGTRRRIKVEPGDVFEIAAEPFGAPLRKPLAVSLWTRGMVRVEPL